MNEVMKFSELKKKRNLSKYDLSDLGYIAFKLRTFLTAEELQNLMLF